MALALARLLQDVSEAAQPGPGPAMAGPSAEGPSLVSGPSYAPALAPEPSAAPAPPAPEPDAQAKASLAVLTQVSGEHATRTFM